MKVSGVGIDAVEISRFRTVLRMKNDRFLENTFTKVEREYCFSFRDAASHFAGTFAAKEAVRKTSGLVKTPMNKIEIRRHKSGKPEVRLSGRRSKSHLISISHNRSIACAIAMQQ